MDPFNSMSGLSVAPGSGTDALGLGAVNVNQQSTPGGLNLDAFDQDLSFDDTLLDNVHGLASLPPFTPSYDFETFSTTFEDPFPYSASTAVTRPYEINQHDPEGFHENTSPQDETLDNKLLGFSAPAVKTAVIDEAGQFAEAGMTAELFGMFFLAEDVYSTENTGRPLELTCYRRNLWWCSGQITLPRQVTHVVTDQGQQVAVQELAASITAIESIEGKPTEIICIPWKSTAASNNTSSNGNSNGGGSGGANGSGNSSNNNSNANGNSNSSNANGNTNNNAGATNTSTTNAEEAKVAGSPPNVPIDLANGQELDNGCVSVTVSWKRLQFKHATANNGRRKGQQQHYVVHINLLARVKPEGADSSSASNTSTSSNNGKEDGDEWVRIAEIQSGPVIVRGRSPRNFVSRRDVPLTGAADKKQQQQQQQQQLQLQNQHHQHQHQHLDRHATPVASGIDTAFQQHRSNSITSDISQSFQRYQLGNIQTGEWAQAYAQQSPHPTKKVALSPTMTRPPVPSWSNDANMRTAPRPIPIPHTPQHQAQQLSHSQRSNSTSHAINLSLSEDERSPQRMGTEPLTGSPPYGSLNSMSGIAMPAMGMSAGSSSSKMGGISSSVDENGDMLYEYFPLSLDDWMPPVDAIYRPHVVHHQVVPPEIKAQQTRSKTKRYFSAD